MYLAMIINKNKLKKARYSKSMNTVAFSSMNFELTSFKRTLFNQP